MTDRPAREPRPPDERTCERCEHRPHWLGACWTRYSDTPCFCIASARLTPPAAPLDVERLLEHAIRSPHMTCDMEDDPEGTTRWAHLASRVTDAARDALTLDHIPAPLDVKRLAMAMAIWSDPDGTPDEHKRSAAFYQQSAQETSDIYALLQPGDGEAAAAERERAERLRRDLWDSRRHETNTDGSACWCVIEPMPPIDHDCGQSSPP